jgi:HlyD family secretion protein
MSRRAIPWRFVFWLALFAVSGAGYVLWKKMPAESTAPKFKTEKIERGDIIQSITANGTLNPVVVINVGTQISGTIQKLHVNFNDRVSAGQVLAELDPSLLNAALKQSQANLASAEANVRLAKTKEVRTRKLVSQGFVVRSQLDEAIETLDVAQAQAQLAKAQIERDNANLRYSTIRSPISGIVIARPVDIGQTVAASFQTPTLFQIAQDLKSMQIDTSVAEADIGKIKLEQAVSFGVDTFPDKVFSGSVRQIRLNPTIQQNVVTYNVVITADNSEGKLLPGMTAHVQINTQRHEQVLRVANAALRYKPSDAELAHKDNTPKLYKIIQGKPTPFAVKLGIADAQFTEIVSGDLKDGDEVIVREMGVRKGQADQGPFRFRMM